MSRSAGKVIYYVLITLVINMGGWTFNKDAVADVWFAEQRVQEVAGIHNHTLMSSNHAKAVSETEHCNHWCHATGHFIGVPTLLPSFVKIEIEGDHPALQPTIALSSYPDDLFRPPRRFS